MRLAYRHHHRHHAHSRTHELRLWQKALLTAGFIWALLVVVPDFYRLGGELGTLGFAADNDGEIYRVATDENPPAKPPVISGHPGRGLMPGDTIDLAAAPCWEPTSPRCEDFLAVFGGMGGLSYVGLPTKVELPLRLKDEPDRVQELTVEAAEEKAPILTKVILFFDEIVAVAVLWRAFSLVMWDRPSRMTLGFFLFVMWFNPGQYFTFYAFLQHYPLALLIQEALQALAQGAGYAGFLIFALRFPKDQTEPSFAPLERMAIFIGAGLTLLQLWSFLNVFGVHTESVTRWAIGLGYAVAFLAFFIVWRRAKLQSPLDYQRIRWVLWGCAIGIPAFVAADSIEATSFWTDFVWPAGFTPDEWILEIGFLMSGLLTVLICEAVRRPRIINITYELRGWVASGIVLVVFALVELTMHARIEMAFTQAKIPELFQVAILITIAISGSRIGHRGAHVAGHWFNRQLYHATTDLQREGLYSKRCQNIEEIDALLAHEPVKQFHLASAAVFREDNGVFRRVATAGEWQAHNRKELVSAENRRTVQDVAAGQAVRLPLPERDEDSSPSDLTAAAIAVPVMIADKLYAIAMYGPHVTGDDVDPLEVKALEDFSQQIGVGYETMKIKSLERENERLREQVSHVGLQAPKPA